MSQAQQFLDELKSTASQRAMRQLELYVDQHLPSFRPPRVNLLYRYDPTKNSAYAEFGMDGKKFQISVNANGLVLMTEGRGRTTYGHPMDAEVAIMQRVADIVADK